MKKIFFFVSLSLFIFLGNTTTFATIAQGHPAAAIKAKDEVYKWKIKRNASKTDLQQLAANMKEQGCSLIVSVLEYEGKKIKNIELEVRTGDNNKVTYKVKDMKKPVCITLTKREGRTLTIGAGPC